MRPLGTGQWSTLSLCLSRVDGRVSPVPAGQLGWPAEDKALCSSGAPPDTQSL